MTGRVWDDKGGEPSRWVAGDSAAAELMRAMGPAVIPMPMTATENARLGERVELLARTGRLPGRGVSTLKLGAVAAGVGLAGLAGFWSVHRISPSAPTPAGVATTAPRGTLAPQEEVPVIADAPSPIAAAPHDGDGPAAVALEAPRHGVSLPTRPSPPLARGGHHARASAPAPVEAEDVLALETRLLDEARELLVESPGRALGILAEHRRRFPEGQLAAEREFMSIDALVRVGRLEEARKRADALRLAHPQSSYVARAARLLDRR